MAGGDAGCDDREAVHVVLVTVGTRGDVQPFVALGVGLRDAGHDVTVATNDDFAGFVAGRGLGFRAVGGNFRERLESPLGREWIESAGSLRRYMRVGRRFLSRDLQDRLSRDVGRTLVDADAVVFYTFALTAYADAEARRIPAVAAALVPWHPSPEQAPVFLPRAPRIGWLRRWVGNVTHRKLWEIGREQLQAYRRELGLAPLSHGDPWGDLRRRGVPMLHLYSEYLSPRPRDWRYDEVVTGFCFLDDHERLPDELERFLAAGPPPVYVGFGSMTGRDPEELHTLAARALASAGQRGVIATGWGSTGTSDDDIFVVESVAHEPLFARVAAAVHHGGAGTTAASLRAGLPTVVTPFFGDQPYWAHQVHRLGAGPKPLRRNALSADRLARAIDRAVSTPTYRENARRIGALLDAEDGVGRATAFLDGCFNPRGSRSR